MPPRGNPSILIQPRPQKTISKATPTRCSQADLMLPCFTGHYQALLRANLVLPSSLFLSDVSTMSASLVFSLLISSSLI
jgi:hypothetical protein